VKFWWLTDTRRLGIEKRAVEELAAREEWFTLDRWYADAFRLSAAGTITAHSHQYPIRLIYPDQFPEVPAWVEPQEDVQWSRHQHGSGGALCLELRPDNWVPSATGADVLRSAYNLLRTEDPLGGGKDQVPSAHSIGQVQRYDWGINPVLIGQACRDRILTGTATDVKALRWFTADDVWPILIHDAEDRVSPRRPPVGGFQSLSYEILAVVADNAPPEGEVDRTNLLAATGFGALVTAGLGGESSSVVLFRGGGELAAFHLLPDKEPFRRNVYVLPDESGVRSNRTKEAEAKSVAIVGAGSVGSKIAESLARSGISRFTLVDGDIMLPANLERHALDWRDVGFRKANGVKRRVLSIVPGAEIIVVDANLNWQRSAKVHARQVEAIADCGMIVDATGDPATSLFLGAVAHANGLPFVSIQVFEGGLGALIATSLPDRDPPYAYGRAAYQAYCEKLNVKPPEPGPRRYEALAGDGTPVVADDAAVAMTAGHAARVILDILDGKPAPVDEAWLLLGYAKGWLFAKGHGHNIFLEIGPAIDQPAPADDPEARDFAIQVFKEWVSEAKDSAQSASETEGSAPASG
jgi:molybdopterin/thiamine biosynthesis adenylyltransferase